MAVKDSKLLYPLRVVYHLFKMPRHVEAAELRHLQMLQHIGELHAQIEQLKKELAVFKNDISILPSIDARLVSLQDKFENQKNTTPTSPGPAMTVNNTVSDNHDFDYFYKLFEDKFRGSEEAIKERVSEHLHFFTEMPDNLKKLPIIDIGCGRGEFLSLMKENQLQATGIDMNRSMVERAKKLGYTAEEADALSYLANKKTGSLAAITGFHVVEHIPFEALLKIFEQCYRTVTSGGFVLFETPNPRALTVGANTFYLDPSHQRPIPAELLAFMLSSVGFKPEIVPLHRIKPELTHEDPVVVDLYNSLYGAGDYAVVARKI